MCIFLIDFLEKIVNILNWTFGSNCILYYITILICKKPFRRLHTKKYMNHNSSTFTKFSRVNILQSICEKNVFSLLILKNGCYYSFLDGFFRFWVERRSERSYIDFYLFLFLFQETTFWSGLIQPLHATLICGSKF